MSRPRKRSARRTPRRAKDSRKRAKPTVPMRRRRPLCASRRSLTRPRRRQPGARRWRPIRLNIRPGCRNTRAEDRRCRSQAQEEGSKAETGRVVPARPRERRYWCQCLKRMSPASSGRAALFPGVILAQQREIGCFVAAQAHPAFDAGFLAREIDETEADGRRRRVPGDRSRTNDPYASACLPG